MNQKQKQKFQPYLYGAYGMNTSRASMGRRCPDARPVGTLVLQDYRLAFRGVADIVPSKRSTMHVALWEITPECEASLDVLEGFRADGGGLYDKIYLPINKGKHRGREVMIYQMTRRDCAPPSGYYEQLLREGYGEFGMPAAQINRAIVQAKAAQRERRAAQRELAWDDPDTYPAHPWEFV